MARVLVGHAQLDLALRLRQADLGQPFAQILHPSFQLGIEILQVRSAARGVDHKSVELVARIHAHVFVAQALRLIQVAVVRVQSATAALALGEPNIAAGKLQKLHRGLMRLRIEDRHHASDQESHTVLARSKGGRHAARGRGEWRMQRRKLAA